MSHTFEQFVRFSTDAAGLERILRLFQSITQILTSYTLPFQTLLLLLSFLLPSSSSSSSNANPINPTTTHTALLGLRNRLALVRRYFRLFRSLESFQAAQKLYGSLSPSSPSSSSNNNNNNNKDDNDRSTKAHLAIWLDVFGRTFNGMYLLLEASTILDVQRIPGLAVWGPEREATVFIEGQRFWLFSLVCAALAGSLRVVDVLSSSSSSSSSSYSSSSSSSSAAVVSGASVAEKKKNKKSGKETGKGDGDDDDDQQAKLLAHGREVRARVSALGRRVVSDALDVTLPGSIVGWVPASTGTVGLAMFVTTILTSMDIWERCGREVAATSKK